MHEPILVQKSVKIIGFKVKEIITHLLIFCAGRRVARLTSSDDLIILLGSNDLGFFTT